MQENEPANVAFYWCTTFVRALFEDGIRNVIISPGSRSTPLTLAFSVHPGFKKIVSIDERSAAFQALGMAKATGLPTVLVCTSGTALANYAPAVTEATNAGIPLIILSADRPPHLRNTGSSQTIDQIKFFGTQPVFFHEVGEPSSETKKLKRIHLLANQTVEKSLGEHGVSHINFCFQKPFEPTSDFLEIISDENINHANQEVTTYKQTIAPAKLDEHFWSQLVSSESPLIIVGAFENHADYSFITLLAETLNAPIIAEVGANLQASQHVISGYNGFLRNSANRNELKPDLILRFGSYPVSKGVQLLLEENDEVLQLCFTTNNLAINGDVPANRTIHLSNGLEIPDINGNAATEWLEKWNDFSDQYFQKLNETIIPSSPLTDGFIMKSAMRQSPDEAFFMVSNSFPIRDVALFSNFAGKEIYVNRGAAGIDGITSTALGLSYALQKTGILFIGDIAFLHDLNALLQSKNVTKPLVIVLFNNGGGTIFRMLPVAKFKETHQTYFETPQDALIVSLCRGFDVNHELISKPEQFAPAYQRCISSSGVHVIECLTDPDDSMNERHKLWDFSLSS